MSASDKLASERHALEQLPQGIPSTKNLRRISAAELASTFSDPQITSGWTEDSRLINSFAIPDMVGGVNPGDQRAIYYLVRWLAPRRVLEIGTHIGCSTLGISLALRRNGNEGRMTTVDIHDVNDEVKRPWAAHGSPLSPKALVNAAGCGHLVEFVSADSCDFLAAASETFDLIFLDGLHTATQVYREIPLATQRLNPQGVVLLHDYFPELQPLWPPREPIVGPALAVARFRAEGAVFDVQPLGTLPWPTKLGSHVTSLALMSASDA